MRIKTSNDSIINVDSVKHSITIEGVEFGWVDDEMQPAIQVVEKTIYKESPTARLPDYFNNNNDGKLIKWVKTKRYMGGKVWSKRT